MREQNEPGEVITAMLAPHAASRLRNASDAQVATEALEMLGRYLPDVGARDVGTHVVHWDQAMPHTPVGRAGDVARYRSELAVRARIVLAGDYLGFPWTDSAAFNGAWAAQHVISSRQPRAGTVSDEHGQVHGRRGRTAPAPTPTRPPGPVDTTPTCRLRRSRTHAHYVQRPRRTAACAK